VADDAKSKSLVCSSSLEGCLSYGREPLPSSGCHDAWMKARLCWSLADNGDNVSHYLVWTCCSTDTVRTISSLSSNVSHPTSESTSSELTVVRKPPDDETVVAADSLSRGSDDECRTVDRSEPPAKTVRRDESSSGTTSVSVWRCLGLTSVTSFSVEHKNLSSFDYQRHFRVQPVLFDGLVLPHVNIVIK